MSPTVSPDPSATQVTPQAGQAVTHLVVEQRPLGDLARGSYVWPAWSVLGLAVAAVGLLLGNLVMGRRKRKGRKV